MATPKKATRQKSRKSDKKFPPPRLKVAELSHSKAMKPTPPPPGGHSSALRQRLGYCLYKGAMRLRALLDETFREDGLITPQFGIISLLISSGPLSQVDIGQTMTVDKATMVKLIDRLEALNLVRRTPHPEDRRIRMVGLTHHGKKKFEVLLEKAKATEVEFTAMLTSHERETLRSLASRLLD
jgi:DNA-binding MarR family transcriptional regulator